MVGSFRKSTNLSDNFRISVFRKEVAAEPTAHVQQTSKVGARSVVEKGRRAGSRDGASVWLRIARMMGILVVSQAQELGDYN